MIRPLQRVAAIHDISGFGSASLTVVIPILSTLGIQVCPVPTAVLSNHSAFPEYSFVDLTDNMREFIRYWKKLNIRFDAIYSGFLGSPKQIEIVIDFIKTFSSDDQLIVVDPVLGDNGILYTPLDAGMINEMKRLIKHSDVITPNITEAAFLLDRPCPESIEIPEIKEWALKLAEKGPEKIVITSVPEGASGKITSVIAYDQNDGRFWKVNCDYLPAEFPGTGDAFTSVIVGCLLLGDSLPIALDRAVQFVSIAIRATFGHPIPPVQGILLEKVLGNLKAPVQISSYEILD